MAPINARTLSTAIVAFTTTGLLILYSRSSIRAAKRDAARQRAADGGQFNWQNESLRKHGAMQRSEGPSLLGALFPSTKKELEKTTATAQRRRPEEEALQAAKRKRPTSET